MVTLQPKSAFQRTLVIFTLCVYKVAFAVMSQTLQMGY